MTATAEAGRAREEFLVAHRLFRRYEHRDPAWLVEFLLRGWRPVLGPDETYEISPRARVEASRLEDSGAPLTGGRA